MGTENSAGDFARYLLGVHSKDGKIKEKDFAAYWKLKGIGGGQRGEALDEGKRVLKDVFGINCIETVDGSKKETFLQTAVPIFDDNSEDPDGEAKKGLLLLILAYIFMKQPNVTSVAELDLNAFLKGFDVDLHSKAMHPVFGNISNLLNCKDQRRPGEFVTLGWLRVGNMQGVDPSEMQFEIQWGARAHKVIPKSLILDFVSKVCSCNTSEWSQHLAVIASMEEEQE